VYEVEIGDHWSSILYAALLCAAGATASGLLVPLLTKESGNEWVGLLRTLIRRMSVAYLFPAFVLIVMVALPLVLVELAEQIEGWVLVAIDGTIALFGLIAYLGVLRYESDLRHVVEQLCPVRMEASELRELLIRVGPRSGLPVVAQAMIIHQLCQGSTPEAVASRVGDSKENVETLKLMAAKFALAIQRIKNKHPLT
jgi:hypothetical protein